MTEQWQIVAIVIPAVETGVLGGKARTRRCLFCPSHKFLVTLKDYGVLEFKEIKRLGSGDHVVEDIKISSSLEEIILGVFGARNEIEDLLDAKA